MERLRLQTYKHSVIVNDMNMKDAVLNDAFARHQAALASMASITSDIQAGADLFCGIVVAGGCVFTCGNGGSAADAEHFAGELSCRYKDDRKPLPAIGLISNPATVTAIGNDYGFEEVFARQIRALGKSGDFLSHSRRAVLRRTSSAQSPPPRKNR